MDLNAEIVMWPSAVVLSTWLLSNSKFICGKKVLELGSGCGLVGLVAAETAWGNKEGDNELSFHVTMTDFNETVLRNIDRNIRLNDFSGVAEANKLDFYDQSGNNKTGGWLDGAGTCHRPVDVVVAADVICKPEDAIAVANTIHDALKPGGKAAIVSADAKHRFGVDKFEAECHRLGLSIISTDVADINNGDLLSSCYGSGNLSGIESTSGYVTGMSLTMFQIEKSNKI